MEWWSVPKMWDGGDCWIIGGGVSMPRQFGIPESVIEGVSSRQAPVSVYSDYLSQLHNKNVIGVNISFMLGDWVSVLYFCDTSFYRVYHKEINAFHNLKVTCVNHLPRTMLPSTRNIKRLRRDMRKGLGRDPGLIQWNYNSGVAAMNFATHAGVKRIILLGFDMKPLEGKTHYHSGIRNYRNSTVPATFRKFLRSFPNVATDAKKMKVEILNVSPESALTCFRKVKLEELL